MASDEFRAAMSRLTAGVVLVAAHDPDEGPDGENVGTTATAFVSVSPGPPPVLVSLRNGSRMDGLLAEVPRAVPPAAVGPIPGSGHPGTSACSSILNYQGQ